MFCNFAGGFMSDIKLSDHFPLRRLLRFTLPSIVMMIFTSVYYVVDGFFVSNYVGKTAFAAINFIYPFLGILGAFGFMFGTGGSALIAKTMGEGDKKKANEIFSLIVYTTVGLAVFTAALGLIFLRPVATWLGAEGALLEDCVTYGTVLLLALPALMSQSTFQSLFIAAEKPTLGLWVSVLAGFTNMGLDYLFLSVFDFGLVGAALASALSQVAGGVFPLIYFSRKNTSLLRLGRTHFDLKALIKTCTNGISELLSSLSLSLVSMLYNAQLLKYAGENGIAANGVLMYVGFLFIAIYFGYGTGAAPVISYHFGAKNKKELHSLLKKSLLIISVCAATMYAAALVLARPLSRFYVGYDEELLEMTVRGFFIYAATYLPCGFSIFASSFFTALNDGFTSGILSFLRSCLFQVVCVLALPPLFGLDGIWAASVAAEMLAVSVTAFMFIKNKKKYGY